MGPLFQRGNKLMLKLNPSVEARQEHCIALRRWFHQHPEPSLEEFHTAEKIEEELDQIGIPHQRVGKTGVYAWIEGKKGPGRILAIRADTDALRIQDLKTDCPYASQAEGLMHACGHDGHTASLLTTAAVLKEKETEFSGTVRLFFQQSEENGQGARQFVQAGLLEGVSRVIGYHGSSDLDLGIVSSTPGENNASCDYFKITVKGKSAHVSQPQKSVDALYIGAMIAVNLQSIVARRTDPLDTVVVGVGVLRSGTTYNIVADEAILEGTTRCFSQQTRSKTNAWVTSLAQQIAAAHGAEAEIVFENFANPLINDQTVSDELAAVAGKIVGTEQVIRNQTKRLGADDFADYLQQVPGCYLFIGTRCSENPNTASAHHHGLFDLDERSMLIASSIFVEYVLWYLNSEK